MQNEPVLVINILLKIWGLKKRSEIAHRAIYETDFLNHKYIVNFRYFILASPTWYQFAFSFSLHHFSKLLTIKYSIEIIRPIILKFT